ncbi:MAG: glycosyltransferase [Thermoplasmata archaeon]
MRVLVLPTTDWLRHPVPNRLNFIFDALSTKDEIHVVDFRIARFAGNPPRTTRCRLHAVSPLKGNSLAIEYSLRSPAHMAELTQLVREIRPDCLVSANILPSALLTFIKRKMPYVLDYLDHFEENAGMYYSPGLFRQLVMFATHHIVRWNLNHSSAVITVSPGLSRMLSNLTESPVIVVPNGVDLAIMEPVDPSSVIAQYNLTNPVLGYVGSLEPWIDLETVIRSMPQVLQKYPKATLFVVGPRLFSDYERDLRRLVSSLGLNERVIFAGSVPYKDLPEHISAMDVGLNPRKPLKMNEYGFGGKVLNYLACGKPVLSSPVASIKEVLGNREEIWFYTNLETLVASFERMVEQRWDRNAIRNGIAQFDWSILAKQYRKALQTTVA